VTERATGDEGVDRRHDRRPFDIVGDVHGCWDELFELLARLGYAVEPDGGAGARAAAGSSPPTRGSGRTCKDGHRDPRAELGLPVRLDWTRDYHGRALVVYGHVAVPEPRWANNTVNIDTGCVFGGRLTALRYPECKVVSVAAARTYFARLRASR